MLHELHANGITKAYPTPAGEIPVLTDINLKVETTSGSVAILGPSGSGKSTLLHILGSLDRPTAGTLSLDGLDLLQLSPLQLAHHRAERIGFVFQDNHLLPQLTALENVLLARLALGSVRAIDRKRAESLLGVVGLAERLTHLPSQLSGGERQRVAIARALLNQPAVLLCDEPTGDLDAPTAAAIGDLLHLTAFRRDTLLIIATHSAALAASCARRVNLSNGHLVEENTPA